MRVDPKHTIDGVAPAAVTRPETAGALADELARAGGAGLRVLPAGRASRMGTGAPVASSGASRLDLLLVTTALARVIEYEPADLTVTVEAGCDVRALDAVLGERGQFLPLQGRRRAGTIGGLLATAPEGALALVHGQPRDSLTGLRAALADGSLIKAGGRVVKNVAGFPIHRLMTGSFGTLGVIVEASFKVQPRPEARGTAMIAFSSAAQVFEAARSLLESGMEPVFVNALLGKAAVRPLSAHGSGPAAARVPGSGRIAGDAAQQGALPTEGKAIAVVPDAGVEAGGRGPGVQNDSLAGERGSQAVTMAELVGLSSGVTLLAVGFEGLESRVKAHLRALADLVAPAKPLGIRFLEGRAQEALRDALDDPLGVGAAPPRPLGIRFLEGGEREALRDALDDPLGVGAAQAGAGARPERPGATDLSGPSSQAGTPVSALIRATALPSRIEESAQAALAAASRDGAWAQADVRPGLGSFFVTIHGADTRALAGATGDALAAARSRGSAVLHAAPLDLRRTLDTWGPSPPDFPLMRRIKTALDPGGLFVAGRFMGGL